MVIKCPNCGNWTEDTSKFCPVCGTALIIPDSADSAAAEAQATRAAAPQLDNTFESRPGSEWGNVFEGGAAANVGNVFEDAAADRPAGPYQGTVNAEARVQGAASPGAQRAGAPGAQGAGVPGSQRVGAPGRQGAAPYGGNVPYSGSPQPPKKRSNKLVVILLGAAAAVIILTAVIVINAAKRIASMVEPDEPGTEYVMPDSDEPGSIYDAPDVFDEDPDDYFDNEDADFDDEEPELYDADEVDLQEVGFLHLASLPEAPEGQVLFEDSGVKITLGDVGLNTYDEFAVNVLIENESDKTVRVSADHALVNTYVMDPFLYESLSPHTRAFSTLEFNTTEFNDAAITNIGEIIVNLNVYDDETYDLITSGQARIETSDYAAMDTTPNDEGYEVVNSDGVRVIAKSIEEASMSVSDSDQSAYFYMQNTTARDIMVCLTDVYVNNTKAGNTSLYVTLPAGSQAVDEMFFFGDELSELGVEQIDGLRFSTSVIDPETYETINDYGEADLVVTYE